MAHYLLQVAYTPQAWAEGVSRTHLRLDRIVAES